MNLDASMLFIQSFKPKSAISACNTVLSSFYAMAKGTPSVKCCLTWFSTTIECVVISQPDTVLLNVREAYLIASYLKSLVLLKHKFTTSCSTPRRQGLWQLLIYVEIHFRFRQPFRIKKYLLCLCMNFNTVWGVKRQRCIQRFYLPSRTTNKPQLNRKVVKITQKHDYSSSDMKLMKVGPWVQSSLSAELWVTIG